MTSLDFSESQFRFTNPIRFFKANDPIYYEVDNIPLKQLQENDLWLKDQIFNLKLDTEGGVERQNINELRPYVDGFDNVVKVKPGRFTARVNDAYNITPLQVITKILDSNSVSGYNSWYAGSMSNTAISTILQGFRQTVAMNMNGLVERAFARPARISDYADTTHTSQSIPKISIIVGTDRNYGQPPYPGQGAVLWSNFTDSSDSSIPSTSYIIRQYDNTANVGFARLGAAETAFIKKWRGIARTAVVDVPEELSIEIPRFNDADFFYYDSNGVKQFLTGATQRIDLLFIYSKPIDTSSTTIAKFVNGVPTTINKAELGIVYGAGLGVNFRSSNSRNQTALDINGVTKNYPETDYTTLPDGTMKMLAHPGDENGQNTGFDISGTLIKGSFPSPDDLVNISPLLDEDLASSSLSLIGQSVLPIAYIVVKKSAGLNSDGTPIITTGDVVDIRPFFRTAELSYNERAGIAAAVPAPSLANPIVTQAELDYELKKTRTEILGQVPTFADIPNPTYRTFYFPTIEDIFFPEPILLEQGTALTESLGSVTNPRDLYIDVDIITSGNPVAFPARPQEPTDIYSRYLTDVILKFEAIAVGGEVSPTTMYASLVDSNATINNPRNYQKVAWAGGWIGGGWIQNGEGYGAVPGSMNLMYMPVSGTSNPQRPPVLPLTLQTFTSRDTLAIPDGKNVNNHNSTSNGAAVLFNIYVAGYRLKRVYRFKGIVVD
jgi:hypothetical protein